MKKVNRIKKYAPYFLILIIVLVGIFSLKTEVSASATNPTEPCIYQSNYSQIATNSPCTAGAFIAGGQPTTAAEASAGTAAANTRAATSISTATTTTTTSTESQAQKELNPGCAVITGDFDDCLVKITYYLFYALPSFLLTLTAQFFNLILSLALSSTLYFNNFIPEAWAIVRDLSNVFFILILLYIAIQTILGLGHETKKMIVQVIIMALLINFSMFFSKVIIDTSNVLALIFYNKINVETAYIPISDTTKTGNAEKDISGAIVSKFDPTKMLDATFWEKARTQTQGVSSMSVGGAAAFIGGGALAGSFVPIVGTAVGAGIGAAGYAIKSIVGGFAPTNEVPTPLKIGIILVAGAVMLYAAYSFLVVGISFVARLIELWLLIIFSPFAFMSSTVPLLSGASGIGWEEWSKRILKVSFMAPVFTFFLYLIFKLVNADLFAKLSDRTFAQQGTLEAIILLVVPTLIVLIILHKATKWAKDASGGLGEVVMKGAKIAGGAALMAVTGGAAMAATGVLGAGGGALAGRLAETETAKKLGLSNTLKDVKGFALKSSFDPRNTKIFGKVMNKAGLDVGEGEEGGWEGMKKRQDDKRMRRADEEEKRETHTERKEQAKAELALHDKMAEKITDKDGKEITVQMHLGNIEEKIKKAETNLAQTNQRGGDTASAAKDLEDLKAEKEKLKGGLLNKNGEIIKGIKQLEKEEAEARRQEDASVRNINALNAKLENEGKDEKSYKAIQKEIEAAQQQQNKIKEGLNKIAAAKVEANEAKDPTKNPDNYKYQSLDELENNIKIAKMNVEQKGHHVRAEFAHKLTSMLSRIQDLNTTEEAEALGVKIRLGAHPEGSGGKKHSAPKAHAPAAHPPAAPKAASGGGHGAAPAGGGHGAAH